VPVRVLRLSKERSQLLISGCLGIQGIRFLRLGPLQSVVEHSDKVVVLVASTGDSLFTRIHPLNPPLYSNFFSPHSIILRTLPEYPANVRTKPLREIGFLIGR
jgi:hypothetical protein